MYYYLIISGAGGYVYGYAKGADELLMLCENAISEGIFEFRIVHCRPREVGEYVHQS